MKLKKVLLILATLSLVVMAGAVAYASASNPEKFKYFVEALKWGLAGLKEYFKFIIELFKVAVGS